MKERREKRVKKRIHFASIQTIITISFTIITILVMAFVGIGLFGAFSESAEESAASSSRQIMDQAVKNVESYLKTMLQISDSINNTIDESPTENLVELDRLLSFIISMRNDIAVIAIFDETGEAQLVNPIYIRSTNYVVKEQDWFIDALENPNIFTFQPPHVQRIYQEWRPWVISLCRRLEFEKNGEEKKWIALVDMNFSEIEELCSEVSLGQRGYIYMIDRSGNIIYHPQQQLIYTGLVDANIDGVLKLEPGSYIENHDGERRIVSIQTVNHSDWIMVGISYVDEIVANRRGFIQYIVVILLVGIAFAIAVTTLISFKISQPIKRLEHQMMRVERGDFKIEALDERGEEEVRRLTKAFNLMIRRIRQLMNQIVSEQEAKRESEFKALQAQINPHFLYNTLDSIVWMNENNNHQGVTEMTAALAKFFRISISRGNEYISVEDEVAHAANYLVIQKIRYKDKFDYVIDIQEEVKQYQTLKLILQPIIENAIYHGISKIQEKGFIKLSVFAEENCIVYQISDNGFGITQQRLSEITQNEQTNKRTMGVGLKNVIERILLAYGKEYGVTIDSKQGEGTAVTIRIPMKPGEEGVNDGQKT